MSTTTMKSITSAASKFNEVIAVSIAAQRAHDAKITVSDSKVVDKNATIDQYGFRINSKRSIAMQMLSCGLYTMKEVETKLGDTYYEALMKLRRKGTHTISMNAAGKYTIVRNKR